MRSLVLRFSRSYLSGLFLSRCHSCCRLTRFSHSRDSTESSKQGLSQHTDHACPCCMDTRSNISQERYLVQCCFTLMYSNHVTYIKTRPLSPLLLPTPTPTKKRRRRRKNNTCESGFFLSPVNVCFVSLEFIALMSVKQF